MIQNNMIQKKAGLYIHLPFCLCRCDYCDFFSQTKMPLSLDYFKACLNHIRTSLDIFGIDKIETIYIGGGTPSLTCHDKIEYFLKNLYTFKEGKNIKEATIELNASDITSDLLLHLQNCKLTRISIGIQSLNNKALEAVNRRGSSTDMIEALDLIGKYWEKDVSCDLIAGLPFETKETLTKSIQALCLPFIDHISLYSLTLEDTKLSKKIDQGLVPYNKETADDLWLSGRDLLEQNGYLQYEVSNFAKKGKQCLHNMGYWQQKDYIGIGAGATGTVAAFRYTNTQDILQYQDFWLFQNDKWQSLQCWPCTKEMLDKKTREFEFLMLGLRTLKGVSAREYSKRYCGDLERRLQGEDIKKRHTKNDTYFHLSKKSLLFLDEILSRLL